MVPLFHYKMQDYSKQVALFWELLVLVMFYLFVIKLPQASINKVNLSVNMEIEVWKCWQTVSLGKKWLGNDVLISSYEIRTLFVRHCHFFME